MTAEERETKIVENMNLVYFTINKYYPALFGDEDMYQTGMEGLIRAVDTFIDSGKYKFSSYASVCIVNSVIGELRKKLPVQEKTEYINDLIRRDIAGDLDVDFYDIKSFVKKLSSIELEIFMMKLQGYSEAEIARFRNVSHQSVNQVVKRMKKKYREWSA